MTLFRALCVAALAAAFLRSAVAQEAVADRVLVRADRLPSAESSAPFAAVALDEETLRTAPQLRLDDILRAEIPGFSLFRRNGSRAANPTTQGVTLAKFRTQRRRPHPGAAGWNSAERSLRRLRALEPGARDFARFHPCSSRRRGRSFWQCRACRHHLPCLAAGRRHLRRRGTLVRQREYLRRQRQRELCAWSGGGVPFRGTLRHQRLPGARLRSARPGR